MSRSIHLAAFAAIASIAPFVLANPAGDPAPVDAPSAEIENSKFQFEGEVNASAVFVRSGPSDNDYATMKLDKGARVTVVGLKFDWLKILPPESSFCYVAKAYVEKRGDGSVGRVTTALNVRVGSELLPKKTKVASRLEPGQDVQIIGEQDEYFKIRPPTDVYLYVNKQFVDPVRRVDVPNIASAKPTKEEHRSAEASPDSKQKREEQAQAPRPPVGDAPGQSPAPSETLAAKESHTVTPPPNTDVQPGDNPSNSAVAITESPGAATPSTVTPSTVTPSTQPSVAEAPPAIDTAKPQTPASVATSEKQAIAADVEFDKLETQMKAATRQPIEQQPIPEMLAGYEALIANPDLPESMRRIAEYRVQTLKVHNENRQIILAHQRDQDTRRKELQALEEEGRELMNRVKSSGIQYYTAVGTLRPSSLQTGQGTMYRLTDPLTGRTVVYIKSDDPKLASMFGLFVGVQGDIVDDAQWKLRWINPTDCQPIEKDKINLSIAAKLIPPSLMPGGALAGTSEGDGK